MRMMPPPTCADGDSAVGRSPASADRAGGRRHIRAKVNTAGAYSKLPNH
jgi:hypothetical protein